MKTVNPRGAVMRHLIQTTALIGGLLAQCTACQPTWPAGQHAVSGEDIAAPSDGAGSSDAAGIMPCRAAATGELVINEVVQRPGGLDHNGDGASNGKDEMVELVSRADVPVHLGGASLWWNGERRGGIASSPCIPPRTAAVLATDTAGPLALPAGAVAVRLDRTLRLTDKGGRVEVRGVLGTALDAVDVPAAVTPSAPAIWSRARDGDWNAALRSHNEVSGASRPASLGRCANAFRYPCCLSWLDDGHP
ncbi:MAG: hypothetical protein KC502_02850 [Myxococcales bacterium]|nr:hypothetical protein [Myxococcales bacterium]